MGEVDKPFICPEQDCAMSFINEDRLQVHQRHHEMQSIHEGSLQDHTSSSLLKPPHPASFIIDQTPTPTRFLKHCEDVSLFQDINLNPFDLEFRKAAQKSYRTQLSVSESHGVSESLETPRILPPVDSDETISSTSRDDTQPLSSSCTLHSSPSSLHSGVTTTSTGGILGTPSPQHTTAWAIEAEKERERREGRKKLTLNVGTSAAESPLPLPPSHSSNVISTPTPVITAGPSVSQSLTAVVPCSSTPPPLSHKPAAAPSAPMPSLLPPSIPHITVNGVDIGLSDLNTPGLSPALRLTSLDHQNYYAANSYYESHEGAATASPKDKKRPPTLTPHSLSVAHPALAAVPSSPSAATVLQLLLRLPDGQAIPVEIPATPVVSSIPGSRTTSSVVTAIAPAAYQTTAFTSVITNPTPSLAKMKLKAALASCTSAARPSAALKLHSRATTAHRIANMTRQRSDATNGGDTATPQQQEDSSSCSSGSYCGSHSGHRGGVDGEGRRRRRSSNQEENPDEKRMKFLERNRVAAVRCREKKKRLVETMVAQKDGLETQNQRLQGEVATLRAEVASLKGLLLRHRHCPVTLAMQEGRAGDYDEGGGGEDSKKFGVGGAVYGIVDVSGTTRLPLLARAPPRGVAPSQPLLPDFKTPAQTPTQPQPALPRSSYAMDESGSKLRKKRSLSLSCIPITPHSYPTPASASASASAHHTATGRGIDQGTRVILATDSARVTKHEEASLLTPSYRTPIAAPAKQRRLSPFNSSSSPPSLPLPPPAAHLRRSLVRGETCASFPVVHEEEEEEEREITRIPS